MVVKAFGLGGCANSPFFVLRGSELQGWEGLAKREKLVNAQGGKQCSSSGTIHIL